MYTRNEFFLKSITLLVYIFEKTQSLCNSDIYSIIRIKQGNKIDKFIRNSFRNSYLNWLKDYTEKDSLRIIHNISYNYWIRSNAAYKINNKNIIKRFIYLIILGINYFRFIIFIFRISLSNIIIKEDKNYINNYKKKVNYQHQFITYLNKKSYYSIIDKVKAEFDEPIIFSNIELTYTLLENNLFYKDHFKFNVLKKICRYLLRYPFMIKYHNNLFKSLYLYEIFKDKNLFKKKFTLCSEVYSLVSRAMSIASLDFTGRSFYIDHSKFDALPYESYSLYRDLNLVNINQILTNKKNTINDKINNNKNSKEILLQASDGCGTISSYEFNCYSNIIQILKELDYEGKLIFKFHPANSNVSVFIKELYCKIKSNDLEKLRVIFLHKEKDIEYFARKSKLIISIDYSTSFNEIISKGSRIIYFNYLNKRFVINKNNLIYKNSNYKMITSRSALKRELKNNIQNIL